MSRKKVLRNSIVILSLLVITAEARVKPVKFKDLIARAAVVVIGNVKRVTPEANTKYAEVKILTKLRAGKNAQTLRYVASPSWACDLSDAKEGEKAIYLLQKTKRKQLYELAASGRGRFLIENIAGTEYLVVLKANDGEVVFPAELKIYDHLSTDEKYLGLIRVNDLVEYMKKELGN